VELNNILKIGVVQGASDVHIKVGLPPIFRINGNLYPLKDGKKISYEEANNIAFSIMNEVQKGKFKNLKEVDLSYGIAGLGRFRVNVFRQRGSIGIVFRVIPTNIKSFEDLNLPKILEKISMETRGLILVTGATGSGKSTTLASMVEYINTHKTCHIITIEDPIEFLFRDKRSIITQREVGNDTESFASALRSALREDPDVILVGEMRDKETIETAIIAAETGHLVMSTLHTTDATESINRIISMFDLSQQKQIRLQLAAVIKSVISQRLLPRVDGKGRVPAIEVMMSTARIRECIVDRDKTKEIHDAIVKGYTTYGMQSFDQSLMSLLKKNLISYEEALKHSSNPSDFALRVRGVTSTGDLTWEDFEKDGT
jgi:twitching motility protein PilT